MICLFFNFFFRQDMLCPPAWAAKLKDSVEEAGGGLLSRQ